jgi:hypothetical protein
MTPDAVMISHVSRAGNVRDESLRQLAAAGVRPRVFESNPERPADGEVKRLAWHAITSARANPHGVLFFEDDILVDPIRLRRFLAGPVPQFDFVALCLLRKGLYAEPELRVMEHKQPAESRLAPIDLRVFRADRGFHGTMGVWLSRDIIADAYDHPDTFMRHDGSCLTHPVNPSEVRRGKVCGFDFWLKDAVTHPAVLFPNAVDHAPSISVINQRVTLARSPSFGIPFPPTY